MAPTAASRRYIGLLLCVNLVVHGTVLGLAGWSLNKFIDREEHRHLGGNTSTGHLLVFSLVAGVVGACSVLPGLLHARAWRDAPSPPPSPPGSSPGRSPPSPSASRASTSLSGTGGGVWTLEAFITISTVTQLLYLILLHTGALTAVVAAGPSCRNRDDCCRGGIGREELDRNRSQKAARDLSPSDQTRN
ncbi:hypothetical protein ACP4OV_000988 [Aristida adscensionis]